MSDGVINPTGSVVAVRHGETEWSASGQHTSRTDIALTEAGRQQALRLRDALAGYSFAQVLCSPRARAIETAQIAGLSFEVDDDLAEWDYGEYEGLTTDEIRARRPGWWMWRDGYPGGENADDIAIRVDRVIARCRAIDGDTALFAHGHLLRVLGARWVEQPVAFGGSLALGTAAVSVLGWDRDAPVIARWNT